LRAGVCPISGYIALDIVAVFTAGTAPKKSFSEEICMLFYYPQPDPTKELLEVLLFITFWGGIALSIVAYVCRKPILRALRSSGGGAFANTSSIEVSVVKGKRNSRSSTTLANRPNEECLAYEHISYSQALDEARDASSKIGWFPRLCGQTHKMTEAARSKHAARRKRLYDFHWQSAEQIKEAIREIDRDTRLATQYKQEEPKEYAELFMLSVIDSIEDLQDKRTYLMESLRNEDWVRWALEEEPLKIAAMSAGLTTAKTLFGDVSQSTLSVEAKAERYLEIEYRRKQLLLLTSSDEEKDRINAFFDIEQLKLME